jgi:hypothetical protein
MTAGSSTPTPVLGRAQNGSPTASAGTLHLHSRFNPEHETRKFLDSALPESVGNTAVVLGASLGYITAEMRRRYPHIRVITLDYTTGFRGNRIAEADSSWDVASGEQLREFLYRVLPEEDIAGLVILSWPPAGQAYPAVSDAVTRELHETISEMNASIATTGYFGKRWFRNAVANFLGWEDFATVPPERNATVVIASGPTLEQSAAAVAACRDRVRVWALASAVTPLLARGILPDLVVLTDAGFYAMEHLWPLLNLRVPAALPLTSARGIWTVGLPVVPLQQGSMVENELLPLLDRNAIQVPPNGTVAGTALELALATTAGPIVFAGFDLGFPDLRSHASPHAFDRYVAYRAARSRPETTLLFERNILTSSRSAAYGSVRTNRALTTFLRWFSSRVSRCDRPIYRLNGSAVQLPMIPIGTDDLPSLTAREPARAPAQSGISHREPASPPDAPRIEQALRMISSWEQRITAVPSHIRGLNAGASEWAGLDVLRFLDMPGLLRIRSWMARDPSHAAREAESVASGVHRFLEQTARSVQSGARS